jgi:hypothetical protein
VIALFSQLMQQFGMDVEAISTDDGLRARLADGCGYTVCRTNRIPQASTIRA